MTDINALVAAAKYNVNVSPEDLKVVSNASLEAGDFVDGSHASVALQNIRNGLSVDGSDELPAESKEQPVDPRFKNIYDQLPRGGNLLWECRTNASCKKEPLPPVEPCDSCSFNFASIVPDNLDFAKNNTAEVGLIVVQLNEGLLITGPGMGAPPYGIAGTAAGYSVSKDGLKYTFAIRKDAKWSDGTQVTAEDFKSAWLRALDPATAGGTAELFYMIKNAEDYNKGIINNPDQVGIRVVNSQQIEVTLKHPMSTFSLVVSSEAYHPIPRHVVDRIGNKAFLPENFVSNGPYQVVSYKNSEGLTMKKNPYYWDSANVQIGKIKVKNTDSSDTAYQWFQLGEVDWVLGLSSELIQLAAERYPDEFEVSPYLVSYQYVFNMQKPPLDDVKVRRAICQNIDRSVIAMTLGGGRKSASSFIHPDLAKVFAYQNPFSDLLIPAGARKNEEGVPVISGAISLFYNTDKTNRTVAEMVQRQLKENLGVEVTAENMERGTVRARATEGSFQMVRRGWGVDYPDPLNFISIFESKDPNNWSKYNNPEFDALIKEIRVEQDTKKRNELLNKAEKLLLRDLPSCPIYFESMPQLISEKVKNFTTNFIGNPNIRFAEKIEK